MTDDADTAWRHPSPRLWQMRLTELLVVTIAIAAFVGAIFLAQFGTAAEFAVVTGILALGVLTGFFLHRRYTAWRYEERHEDLLVGRGVMVQRLSVVPYGRMQFIEVTAGPIERLFSLSTVKLHTAAAASDARIPGLEPAEANRLRDRLTELGEAMAAGM
jgi:membrane protein YdbS with pleckstrin-like domain